MEQALHVVCPNCDTTNRVASDRLGSAPKCGKCKQKLFSGHPIELTNDNFDRHITANGLPVIVDFWAPWCGPCRAMAPAYEQAAARIEPRARLAKLDTEAEPGIASRYGIRGIPTMIAFKGGREAGRQSGALDLSRIVEWVDAQL